MKRIKYLYSGIYAITLPILIILLAFNITFRTSEVYSYYFNDSQSIDYTTLDVTSNELADSFASFLNDLFSSEVDITENSGYEDDPIFDDVEGEVLLQMKTVLTSSFIIAFGLLIIDIIMFIILHRREEDELLFKVTKTDIIATLILSLASGITFATQSVSQAIYDKYINIQLPKDSVLTTLFSKGSFSQVADVCYIGIGIILLALVFYIVWTITKPEKIFNRR